MKKATFVAATYQESDTIHHQGNRGSIDAYKNQGYHVSQSRNGYWVLTKPASVYVCLRNSNNITLSFNMKENILKNYNKTRISRNLFDKFEADCKSGKIQFYMDDNSYYFK